MDLAEEVARTVDDTGFSGVVGVRGSGATIVELAAGLADRTSGAPNELGTRFAIASGTKGLTALVIAGLVESGELSFDTPLRALVGDDLTHVDPAVTIEQLLAHTAGVGDYLDETVQDDVDDHVLTTPVHRLTSPDAYLPMVASPPQVARPGERFAYNNGGYVMLSIAAERATGRRFHELVDELVLQPAGMRHSGFFRSDRLPPGTAAGYLDDGRSNVFHLPVLGAGDGGAFSTLADVEALWTALFAGRIVSSATVDRLTAPRSDVPAEGMRYGLGFWLLADRPVVVLEGMDAGVSFRSTHDPATGSGYTVVSNTSRGAWPVVRLLEEAHLDPPDAGISTGALPP